MTKPNEYEKKTYKWRQHSESLDPSYCGSCSIEVHMNQMSDPECWVQSGVKMWERDWNHTERLKKHGLRRSSTVADCLNSLDATARGERSADREVETLRGLLQASRDMLEALLTDPLLKRYAEHVHGEEGSTFIWPLTNGCSHSGVKFTEEEIAILGEIDMRIK